MRNFLIMLAVIALGLALLFRFIFTGLEYEYRIGLYDFFTEIVGRAIQLEQLGEMGWVSRRYDTPLPDDMQRAREYLRNLWYRPPLSELLLGSAVSRVVFGNTGHDFDCSADIQLKPVSAREVWPVLGTMLSYDPFRYVVVFAGDPPDIAPFLDEARNADLTAPLVPFDTPPGKANELARRDMTGRFAEIQRLFPNGISWKSVECENFSYFEFREK
jgi:hypothetical protein